MKSTIRFLALLFLLCATAGCVESNPQPSPMLDTSSPPDEGRYVPDIREPKEDAVSVGDDRANEPSNKQDVHGEQDAAATDLDAADVGPGPATCDSNEQCDSGWCIQTADGRICTEECVNICPTGFVCALSLVMAPETDPIQLCVPHFLDLCRPCQSAEGCNVNYVEFGQACVSYGPQGSFCGVTCDPASPDACPEGYACADGTDVDGQPVKQCILSDGECGCTPWDVEHQAGTACFVQNELGQCAGERVCGPAGLSACDAATPAPEKCNGLDDDCDGEVDEELGEISCGAGPCQHAVPACADGVLQVCDPYAGAAAEVCDGADNDCDGLTDEELGQTTCGVGACFHTVDNCLEGQAQECDPKAAAADETCDAIDNDCDAAVDEELGEVSCGEGECFHALPACLGGGISTLCDPMDGALPEECDGLDNDCNGQTDELFPDQDADGQADCVDQDLDGDGLLNASDNCPAVVNPGQEDADQDGTGDACDSDLDGDSVPDGTDNCPAVANPTQSDVDEDKLGDACDDDQDGDGILNDADNCPLVSNPGQEDADKDGKGDACEADADGDGTPDSLDCAPLNPLAYPGAEEACNGIDDDCDAAADEGFSDFDADSLKDCVDPDDDNDADPDETDCAPHDPAVSKAAVEACNGLDDDCDGKIDEALGTVTCGKGACTHATPLCISGKPATCDPMLGASLEKCDGLDNDCNGQVDEGFGFSVCGEGTCLHVVPACKDGKPQVCDPLEGAAEEACNGLDDDCDGEIDEELGTSTCGLGACLHTVLNCMAGKEQVCDPLEGKASETCNGLDDDCDGDTDEELGNVECGKGACLHSQPKCDQGQLTVCDPTDGASAEACDGIDNDCDGLVDDGLGSSVCGLGMCLHAVPACVDGSPQVCDPGEGAQDEVCDKLDNDCNGIVDDLGSTTCGLGPCLHSAANCVDGQVQTCDPHEGAVPEICDGLDNDCDGEVDQDLGTFVCGKGVCAQTLPACVGGAPPPCDPNLGSSPEKCDGKDNNCDGIVDNGYPDADSDGLTDCIDPDDDNDGDPDTTDCAIYDPTRAHTLPEVCFNNKDDDCNSKVDDPNVCTLADCKTIHQKYPNVPDGQYTVDPDGAGALTPFAVWCDMVTDGGGWTVVYAATGANGEQPLTGDGEATTGKPLNFQYYNISRWKKVAITGLASESIFKRNNGTWLKTNHALFDFNLAVPSNHAHWSVLLTANNGVTAQGFVGYSNFNNTGGGDYNVSMTDGATCCGGYTSNGVDHHSTTYYHLNCCCQRLYLYSYSGAVNDGDAGYDVNTALGSWAKTADCDSGEGGTLMFYAAMR